MRLGIFFEGINPETGGAFSILKHLLSGFSDSKFLKDYEIHIFGPISISRYLPDTVKLIEFPRKSHSFKCFVFNLSQIFKTHRFVWLRRQHFVLNRLLQEHRIDLFLSPFPLRYKVYKPYINTVWDLGHLDFPFFPEFSSMENDEFEFREKELGLIIKRAAMNIVSNDYIKERLVRLYGIDPGRVSVVGLPISTSPSNSTRAEKIPNFIIYPAQFWPHKNHVTLLKAIKQLNQDYGIEVILKLIGSDRGSKASIVELVSELDLVSQVEVLEFVEQSALDKLYEIASILVFPSLLGPDNLPPIEGIQNGCRVLVSDVKGAREIYGSSVCYFDPLDPDSLAKALSIVINEVASGILLNDSSEAINKSFVSAKVYLDKLHGIVRSMDSEVKLAQFSRDF